MTEKAPLEIMELLLLGQSFVNEYNNSPSQGAFANLVIQLMIHGLELLKGMEANSMSSRDFRVVTLINSPEFPEQNTSAYFLSPIDPT